MRPILLVEDDELIARATARVLELYRPVVIASSHPHRRPEDLIVDLETLG